MMKFSVANNFKIGLTLIIWAAVQRSLTMPSFGGSMHSI